MFNLNNIIIIFNILFSQNCQCLQLENLYLNNVQCTYFLKNEYFGYTLDVFIDIIL